jgi:hypothetical protein
VARKDRITVRHTKKRLYDRRFSSFVPGAADLSDMAPAMGNHASGGAAGNTSHGPALGKSVDLIDH